MIQNSPLNLFRELQIVAELLKQDCNLIHGSYPLSLMLDLPRNETFGNLKLFSCYFHQYYSFSSLKKNSTAIQQYVFVVSYHFPCQEMKYFVHVLSETMNSTTLRLKAVIFHEGYALAYRKIYMRCIRKRIICKHAIEFRNYIIRKAPMAYL